MDDNNPTNSHPLPPLPSPPADYLLYHEPQAAALCGLHAMNVLLQGPYIDEGQCADIALHLDAQEHALMAEAGVDNVEFLRFVAEDSSNVRADGMFSIQVLSKALEMWGLTLVPLSSPDAGNARAEPQAYTAFICNLAEHWFTIRKIHGEWWNLNSMFSHPELLSPFYLAAFLGTLQEQGYTIFLVRGPLMEPDGAAAMADGSQGNGQWILASEAKSAAKQKQNMKQKGFLKAAASNLTSLASAAGTRMLLRSGKSGAAASGSGRSSGIGHEFGDAAFESELQRALEASRKESGAAVDDDFEEDPELAAALAASLADHQQHSQVEKEESQQETVNLMDMDGPAVPAGPVLPMLGEEPSAETEGVLEVGVKLPSGERKSRKFFKSDTVAHVAAFAAACGVDVGSHRLLLNFPRRQLEDLEKSLEEAGISNKEVVVVEPKG